MALDTVMFQGSFTSTGVTAQINFRSDIDWMRVINLTTTAAGGADTGSEFFWAKGFPDGYGIEYIKTAATNALASAYITSGGFTRIDSSGYPDKAINATVTAISNAAIPIVSATSTAGLVAGDVVRFVNVTGAQQFGGMEFTIDTVVANTSFRLPYAPQIVAGTTGSFYPIKWGSIFYPRRRIPGFISQAANAVILPTVTHGYTVGQKVRFQIPEEFGMVELNGLTGTVIAVDLTVNSFTVDIDTSGFTAYAWPLSAAAPFTPAQIIPVGEAVEYNTSLDDATRNTSVIAMLLSAGTNSPAGVNTDVIFWQAGKTFNL